MHIKSININNFRKLLKVNLEFNKNLNFIIGENDSGKTALIDALKLVLGTVSNDFVYLQQDDFYNPSAKILINIILAGFTNSEASQFIDWGAVEADGKFYVKITFEAECVNQKIFTKIKGGTIHEEDEGKALETYIRAKLNSIYLKPLRDAERDLSAGKNSRLSQILMGHKYFDIPIEDEPKHDIIKSFDAFNNGVKDYFNKNHDGKPDIINQIINENYEEFMGSDFSPIFLNTGASRLKNILEKLSISHVSNINPGLGTNNLLFIASELLLLKERSTGGGLGVALIEEIEAHIHPQKQLTLIDFLQKKSEENNIQIFVTSHSPNIASKVKLQNIIICKNGIFNPLRNGNTILDPDDYNFLERFLDVTRSDLFFARGLIFVEGIAEALLIPVIAEAFDINLNKLGISVINLGGLSFERYYNIFIKKDALGKKRAYLGTKISCITDRDLRVNPTSDERITNDEFKEKVDTGIINDSSYPPLSSELLDEDGMIRIFYNKYKTLEYDLGLGVFFDDLLNARKKVQSIRNEALILGETDIHKKSYMLYQKISSLKGDMAQQLSFIWKNKINDPAQKIILKSSLESDPYIRYIIDALKHVSTI